MVTVLIVDFHCCSGVITLKRREDTERDLCRAERFVPSSQEQMKEQCKKWLNFCGIKILKANLFTVAVIEELPFGGIVNEQR